MRFIYISIDICGSTAAKAKLLERSSEFETEAANLYEYKWGQSTIDSNIIT